eukprot:10740341-Lingulodinium_polyedra.AAC.1
MVLLVMCVVGVPLSWAKVRGGLEPDFVGYGLDVARHRLGLAQGRAQWLVSWLQQRVGLGSVVARDLQEGPGRL